ncbi:retrovirus-related pol polyprotein from transposon TNT 1-94 [Tanacetum coccineum]
MGRMRTEMELALEQTQQGASYEARYALKRLMNEKEIHGPSDAMHNPPQPLKFDESNANVLERFYTSAGNPVKEILLKLNLPDHMSILTDSKVTPTKHGRMTKTYSSPLFIANCFNAGYLKMVVKNGRNNGNREQRKRYNSTNRNTNSQFPNRPQTGRRSTFKAGVYCTHYFKERHIGDECYKLKGYLVGHPLHGKYKPPVVKNSGVNDNRNPKVNLVSGQDVASTSTQAETSSNAGNDVVFVRIDQHQNQMNQVLLMMQQYQKEPPTGMINSHTIRKHKFIASVMIKFKTTWGLNRRIAHGNLCEGLYIIFPDPTPTSSPTVLRTSSSNNTILWHSRLGHPSATTLKQIKSISISCNSELSTSDGTIDKYKAKLVAKGHIQKEGIDFHETFAAAAKMVTVRALIATAVHNNWPIAQMDINNAFLNGDLPEEIYMKLPQGYPSSSKTSVCKLQKSLYGLKHKQTMVLQTDKLPSKPWIQSKNTTGLIMTQRKYTLELLQSVGVLNIKPSSIPFDPIIKLNHDDGEPLDDPSQYRTLVPVSSYGNLRSKQLCPEVQLK